MHKQDHTVRNVLIVIGFICLGVMPAMTVTILVLAGAGFVVFKFANRASFLIGNATASAGQQLRESYEQGKLQVHPHPPIIISGFDARKFDMEEAYKRFNNTVEVIRDLPIDAQSKKDMIEEELKILKGVLKRIMS